MNKSHEVCAIVSSFNPAPSLIENVMALTHQVESVIIVDDGSSDPSAEQILADCEKLGCSIIRLDVNSGIARALNVGIERTLTFERVPSFILTMDQDSQIGRDYVLNLVQTFRAAELEGQRVGMVSPDAVGDLRTKYLGRSGSVVLGGEPIQSGLLIPLNMLKVLGNFDEELFIDGVDSEFYLRSKGAGYSVVIATGSSVDHSLGTFVQARIFGHRISLFGKDVRVRIAANLRYYYIFRNRILLTKAYGRRNPVWALKGFASDYRHLLIVTIAAAGKAQRLSAALAGIRDGLKGITGPRRFENVAPNFEKNRKV